MENQSDYLSSGHKNLLNIAIWAKYLAWVILFLFILSIAGTYIQAQTSMYYATQGRANVFTKFLAENQGYTIGLIIQLLGVLFKGITYFLVLKAISLGLNMIVETDINYRDRKEGEQ
jgi:hypothetical protein